MTGISDDNIVVREGWYISSLVDGLLQFVNALAKLCADGYKGMIGQSEVVDIAFVGLVSYNDKTFIFNTLKNVVYFFVSLNDLGQPEYHIVPSKIVSKTISEGHAKWLKTPGKKGQPHNDNPMREFTDENDKYLNNWSCLS